MAEGIKSDCGLSINWENLRVELVRFKKKNISVTENNCWVWSRESYLIKV